MKTLGFLQAHRLCLKKDIDMLFTRGNSFSEFPLRFIWYSEPSIQTQCNVAISIPKKRFAHAVDRNKLKRRIRESFRLFYQQHTFSTEIEQQKFNIMIVYIDNTQHSQQVLQEKIEIGLKKILTHA